MIMNLVNCGRFENRTRFQCIGLKSTRTFVGVILNIHNRVVRVYYWRNRYCFKNSNSEINQERVYRNNIIDFFHTQPWFLLFYCYKLFIFRWVKDIHLFLNICVCVAENVIWNVFMIKLITRLPFWKLYCLSHNK